MNNTAANIKRREKDVMKLMMSGKYEVNLLNEDSTQEFEVLFTGPKDSPYEEVSYLNYFKSIQKLIFFAKGILESLSAST